MDKKILSDLDVAGKKVLVRVDFNVPQDAEGNITDDNRMQAALPTIQYLLDHDAAVILMSHLGRPKGQVNPKFTLKPVAKLFPTALEKLRVKFGSADYAAASPMMRQCLVKAVNEDLTHLLPGIKAPTLLVWGDRDTATPLRDGQQMEKAIPGAGLAVIPGTGHFSFVENPYLFGRIMASYFGLE